MKPSNLIANTRNFFTKVKAIMYIFISTLFFLFMIMVYTGIGTIVIWIISIIFICLNFYILIKADKEIKNIDDFLIKHLMNFIKENEKKKKV